MKTLHILFSLTLSCSAFANTLEVNVYSAQQADKKLGHIHFRDTAYGLLITPHLSQLSQGLHGFHLHEHAKCSHEAQDAGNHFDPQKTDTHQGPYQGGHLGDLPALFVNDKGEASTPVLAPKLKTDMIRHTAVIIHEGSDTYADNPKLGGGGARIACGVVD
jgi:Cu-Zn family superoxide dismutase